MLFQGVLKGTDTLWLVAVNQAQSLLSWSLFLSKLPINFRVDANLRSAVHKLSVCQAAPHTQLQVWRGGEECLSSLTLSASGAAHGLLCPH